jgi:hypothetical protein
MKLNRIRQCKKCPWRVDVDPHDIPNGYDEAKHKDLISTIADPHNPLSTLQGDVKVMACHETDNAHCVGWLFNQLGQGNNIGLRLQMSKCSNVRNITVIGEQHDCFEKTLPVAT